MKNDILKALELIVSELSNGELKVVKVMSEEPVEIRQPREETKEEVKKEVKKEVKETKKAKAPTGETAEELATRSVAELKDMAKSLGVAIRGSKSAIIGRILEARENMADDEEVAEEIEEEVEIEELDEVEDDVTEDDEEMSEEEELQAKLEQLDVEDLADLCSEFELSSKGKKQGLIARLVKAHIDGDIDLSDLEFEEEEEAEASEEDEEGIDLEEVLQECDLKSVKALAKECDIKVTLKDKKPTLIEKLMEVDADVLGTALVELGIIEAEIVEEGAEEEEEVEEVTIEFKGSEARQEACHKIFESVLEEIENGDVEEADVREFFEDRFKGNKSELKRIEKSSFEELAIEYAEISANLVDDEGEEVEVEEPYMVGETPYCCGVPMKKLKGNNYLCEIDGEEVELEE